MVVNVCDNMLGDGGVHGIVLVMVVVEMIGSMYVLVGIKMEKSEAILCVFPL